MKIISIASVGGHWIQLLRISFALSSENELVFMSTKSSFSTMVKDYEFYAIPDANRHNKIAIFKAFIRLVFLMRSIKPDVVLTTGAAPGLLGIIVGKLFGAKTIWIDSIANVEELSMSGKIALKIADRIYTQWPELANKKCIYQGNILS